LQVIEQKTVTTETQLFHWLDTVVEQGGEGLMLHHKNARYITTQRNSDLMKLKKYQDAEATVIAHMPGKGKYTGMLGAIAVKTPQGIIFNIGSGFSDQQRQNPPKVGTLITYKYFGLTKYGKPRFASFVRERLSE
jgi:DNA ligase-1